jgi:hypothetical protein
MVQSDFDFQSVGPGVHQEYIELDLFHYGLEVFSEQDFIDAGLNSGDQKLIEYIAIQEASHASLLSDMLGEAAPKQCTYDYPFTTVREFIDFNARLTRWGESGNWGFLSHHDSTEVATPIVQAEAIEARQQAVFRQMLGLHAMPVCFAPGTVFLLFLGISFLTSCKDSTVVALDLPRSVHQFLSGRQHPTGLAKLSQSPRSQSTQSKQVCDFTF